MATRSTSLSSRLSALNQTANKGKEHSQKITEETNLSEMTEDELKKVKYLSVDQLIEDPENIIIYGSDYKVDDMAEDMKRYGFQGVILAYPDNGKYMIEGGHRRVEAFKLSGRAEKGEKIPVYITAPPQASFQRTLRLIRSNQHARGTNPIQKSNEAEALIKAHGEEYSQLMFYKKIKDFSQKDIIALTASDLEVSVASVYKLRQFYSISDSLKHLAVLTDAERGLGLQEVSWTELAGASTLSPTQQEVLAEQITKERLRTNAVSGSWVSDQIKKLKNTAIPKQQEEK